ncbi:MAG: hypothetical protein ACO3A4_11275 [Silvanigrellaceae bacterium]
MIVNTQNSKISKFTTAALSFVLLMMAASCKTPWWTSQDSEIDKDSFANSGELQEQNSRNPILTLTADDFQGVSSRGAPVYWQPLIMPLKSGFALTDRHFALGITGSLGNIDGRLPPLGQCQLLSNSSTASQASGQDSLPVGNSQIELENAEGERIRGNSGQLFLVHDQISRFVKALGFWDDEGVATCKLPPGRWIVSTGFGEARTHKAFSVSLNQETRVSLRTHVRAKLIIKIGKETGLQFGDLMRIGRVRAQQPAPQAAGLLPEVPLLIPDDLMRMVLSPSENKGVREYLLTSLLLQRPEFSIQLEPGEYHVGLWRDGNIRTCVSKLQIKPADVALLACDPSINASLQSDRPGALEAQFAVNSNAAPSRTIVFDGSFMPSRLLSQSSFRAWMSKSGVNRFLRAGRLFDNQQQQLQFLLQPLMQAVNVDSIIAPDGPFIGDFRLTQNAETDEQMARSSFARLLFAQAGMSLDSLLSRIFKPIFTNTIPVSGISERGLLEGVVPLTFRTHLRSAASRTFRSEETESFVSNGSQIDWIDPLPASSGSPLKLGPQQRIRLRLRVPPEDTTEFLTMFVNGERYKQWAVPVSPLKNMVRTLEIDEKATMTKDFYIGFASWGKNYLSEFMFGVKQLPAIAFTRLYCVDLNENSVCDRQ